MSTVTAGACTFRKAPPTSEVSYRGALRRVRYYRGRADVFTCECGAAARDWSYEGGAALERTERQRSGSRRFYSLDVADYAPRCHSCSIRRGPALKGDA